MSENNLFSLKFKVTAIFSAALAAITGVQSMAPSDLPKEELGQKVIQMKKVGNSKPMPVFKLNQRNSSDGHFVSSHRSHASHSSHSSHYSHRSGAMFS